MAGDIQNEADLVRARIALVDAFNPSGPVADTEFFAGRIGQLARVLGAVRQQGQHVILYGERGVGKTSLAGLVHEFWNQYYRDTPGIFSARYNCEPIDRFGTIWASIAEIISDTFEKRGEPVPVGENWKALFDEIKNGSATPHLVRRLLDLTKKSFVIVIDEFDQIKDANTIAQFASTLKGLSDYLAQTTLIIVGVADTIDELIENHQSVDRALVQVKLPLMSTEELEHIIGHGYSRAGLEAGAEAIDKMGRLAQGLPHYAHRFGQEAGFAALRRGSLKVESEDIDVATREAIEQTDETVRRAYRNAVISPQNTRTLFNKVLLACALAQRDDLGFFAASDIREPLAKVAEQEYDIPQFVGHLKKFCTDDKGSVLESEGVDWKRRYRFRNPLMRPYVVLRGIREELIDEQSVKRFEHANSAAPRRGHQARLL